MNSNAFWFDPLGELKLAENFGALDLIVANRERFLIPVRQPLLLVPQIQRSGGTLISQLLDGHSQIHSHPSELSIGKPKFVWPTINLDAPPTEIFEGLREDTATRHARAGYLKLSKAEYKNPNYKKFILPFIFLDSLQKGLFVKLMQKQPPSSQRNLLDHYASSYFNAWLDYSGLYRDPNTIKFWNAFIARFLINKDNGDRFFQDYPDGKMIVPTRDPVSWYASARAHDREYADLDTAIDLWVRCNNNALDIADKYPSRIVFVKFENLVRDTRNTMAALLRRLDLCFEPGVLEPTFNRIPIVSDSSFGAKFGIDPSAIDRTPVLDAATREHIVGRTSSIVAAMAAKANLSPAGD